MRRAYLACMLIFAVCKSGFCQQTTFNDVRPIFQQKCMSCHTDGEIGPMPLTNYDEISAFGQMVRYVVDIDYMPPFLVKKSHHTIKDSRVLTPAEKTQIINWVDGGLLKDSILTLDSDVEEFTVLDYDVAFSMEDSFEQYGVYYDQYRVFVIPTKFDRDTFVSAIQFVPGNRDIVRHASISIIQDTAAIGAWDKWDPNAGYFSFGDVGAIPSEPRWYNWQPGKGSTIYPSGQSRLIPKGSKILLHIHYGPSNKKQKDLSRILLKFTNNGKQRRITQPIIHSGNYSLQLQKFVAGKRVKLHTEFVLPVDMLVHGIMPHAHFLCRDWDIYYKDQQGRTTELLKITDWDFKWRQMFEFEKPIRLAAGGSIHALATFDNTDQNILNPSDPPADVPWGKGMFEEMMVVYVDYAMDNKINEHISLGANPVMIAKTNVELNFTIARKLDLYVTMTKVNSEKECPLTKLTTYNKGNHTVELDLGSAEYGNYLIKILDKKGELIAQHLIAFVNPAYFGVWEDAR